MGQQITAPTVKLPPVQQRTGTPLLTAMATSPQGPYLAMIIPSDEGERTAQAMENWFQACASDEAFALELVGTAREQGFVLRASSKEQLNHLCKQLEAQYPQCEVRLIAPGADPLRLHPGEFAVVGTFALQQASWMPIKTFSGKALAEAGSDPLVGLLAAMEAVGPGQRVISQIVLVRAPEHWLGADLRKSVEHPLQPERDALLLASKGISPRSELDQARRLIALLALSLGGVFAYRFFQAHAWMALVLLGIVTVGVCLGLLWWYLTRRAHPLYDMKLVAEKMARAGFYCQLRVIVIGREPPFSPTASRQQRAATLRARQRSLSPCLQGLEIAYRQYTQSSANGLLLKQVTRVTSDEKKARALVEPLHAFRYARLLPRLLHKGAYSPWVLNSFELAGLFHLPQESADLPLVHRLPGKRLLALPEIAHQVQHTPAPLPPAYLGMSTHRRHQVPVLLPYDALFRHMAAFGMSRTGKTVLMLHLVLAAMHQVRDQTPQPGLFCIDPHRDFIMDILKLVAPVPELAQRVVLLDMTDTAFPVALNPLDASMGFTRDQAVSNLMSSFREIWREFWGPRMAYFLNAVCLLLYTLNEDLVAQGKADQQYTLLDINPLLQYRDYALKVLSQLNMRETWHQQLLSWWKNTYFTLPPNSSFRQEVIMPILSKIGVFADNTQLRRIVGQPITHAPVHLAITQGKIVLCALSSKDMSEEAVNILGSTLINLLHSAFTLQQALPLPKRRKVLCALDEFHAFSGSQLDRMLSEDAKLGCAMLLASQNLKRLNKIKDGLMEMVFSNCQQLFTFRVSAADAKLLEEEFQSRVTQKHIISQPALHCYARLVLDGYPLQIVSLHLARPASWQDHPHQAASVNRLLAAARVPYLPAEEVERRYAAHVRTYLNILDYAATLHRDTRATEQSQQQRAAATQVAEERLTMRVSGQGSTTPSRTSDEGTGSVRHRKYHTRSRRMGKASTPSDTRDPSQASSPTKASPNEDGGILEALRPLAQQSQGGRGGPSRDRERGE